MKLTLTALTLLLLLLWMPDIHAFLVRAERYLKNKIKEVEDEREN